MNEKTQLIFSMEKLIAHISNSVKSQEGIFASLTVKDLRQMVSNLSDDNAQLRNISLLMLTRLLYAHDGLKNKFCKIMAIPTIPGRIALNNKLPSFGDNPNTKFVTSFLQKLKKAVSSQSVQHSLPNGSNDLQEVGKTLLWYMPLNGGTQNAFNIYEIKVDSPDLANIDPANCLVGFILENDGDKNINTIHIEELTANRKTKAISMTSTPVSKAVMSNQMASQRKQRGEDERNILLGKSYMPKTPTTTKQTLQIGTLNQSLNLDAGRLYQQTERASNNDSRAIRLIEYVRRNRDTQPYPMTSRQPTSSEYTNDREPAQSYNLTQSGFGGPQQLQITSATGQVRNHQPNLSETVEPDSVNFFKAQLNSPTHLRMLNSAYAKTDHKYGHSYNGSHFGSTTLNSSGGMGTGAYEQRWPSTTRNN